MSKKDAFLLSRAILPCYLAMEVVMTHQWSQNCILSGYVGNLIGVRLIHFTYDTRVCAALTILKTTCPQSMWMLATITAF